MPLPRPEPGRYAETDYQKCDAGPEEHMAQGVTRVLPDATDDLLGEWQDNRACKEHYPEPN